MTGTAPPSAAVDALPPELVRRFADALARLNPAGGRIGLAVSGGPDSMAMLLLAHAAIPGEFEVATVDHGLRAESAEETAFVADRCEERGIRCDILKVRTRRGNLQAEARNARYKALIRWSMERNLVCFATAHHADDQAETLLMRLNRGSGISGLGGIREFERLLGSEVSAIRPLLSFTRKELASVVRAARVTPVEDPSNADARFDRARIRIALAGNDWLDVQAMASSAAILAKAKEALDWAAWREWRERVVTSDDEVRYSRPPFVEWVRRHQAMGSGRRILDRAPQPVVLELLKIVMRHFDSKPRGGDLARLIDKLENGESGNLGGVLATVEGDDWVFRREPPRRSS